MSDLESFKDYDILKYIDWEYGREYSKIVSNDLCLERSIDDCETSKHDGLKCQKIKKKNLSEKCVSSKNVKKFEVNQEMEHGQNKSLTFIDDSKQKGINFEFDFTGGYEYLIRIFSCNLEEKYYVLFNYGEDIILDINNKGNQNDFNKIINFINKNCKNQNYTLHLYGHSMGSLVIRYLLSYLTNNSTNHINIKNITVRISGVFFNREFLIQENNGYSIDYKSLNLGIHIQLYDYYYVDGLKSIEHFNKIENHNQNNTLIGILFEEDYVKNYVINIEYFNQQSVKIKSNFTFKMYKRIFYLHSLTNILIFINKFNNPHLLPSTPPNRSQNAGSKKKNSKKKKK